MLSILIPVRNGEKYIAECLRSVFSQQGITEPIEILISDNLSSDNSPAVVEAVIREQGRAPRIPAAFIRQQTNLGAYGNLNFLLSRCSYQYAAILCADDYFNAGAVAKILSTLKSYPDVAIFAFDNNKQHKRDPHWRLARSGCPAGVIEGERFSKLLLTFGCFLGGLSNLCVNRSYFTAATFFDPTFTYYGDFDFYARAAMRGATLHLSDYETTYRRDHTGSISSTANASNARVHESMQTTAQLFDHLNPKRAAPLLLRFYTSTLIAQFYWAGLKSAIRGRDFRALRAVVACQKGRRAFLAPFWCLLIALATWPKGYRSRLQVALEARFLRALVTVR